MKIALKCIVTTRRDIESLQNLDRQPPQPLSIKLIRNLRQINHALRDFDDANFGLLKEYGAPNDNGGYSVSRDDPDQIRRYADEYRALIDHEVDIDIHKIPIHEVLAAQEKRDGFEIAFGILVRMDYLFCDDQEQESPEEN